MNVLPVMRAKRFSAVVKIGRNVTEFGSVNKAIQSLNLPAKSRGLRAIALEMGLAEVDVDGVKVQIVAVPKN